MKDKAERLIINTNEDTDDASTMKDDTDTNNMNTNSLMTALHTTLLGPTRSAVYTSTVHVPGAGLNDTDEIQWPECVHSVVETDMKKVDTNHVSPNLKIHLSRSPTMIGGRV